MSENRMEIEGTCRVCGQGGLLMVLSLGDQPHTDSLLNAADLDRREPHYPLDLAFCPNCTTAQIPYTVPKEEMFSEYLYVSGTTVSLRRHFAETSERLAETLGLEAGDLVVDIGSNDGTWLACHQPRGLRTLGVECAGNLVKLARANGVNTMHAYFNEESVARVIAEHGHPHLVTASGVFFHLEELHSATAGVATLCEKGGTFCVQVIYLGEILRLTQFDNIYHEHLTYWSATSITRLFEQHNLEINQVRRLPIHGGSLEMLVSRTGCHPVDPAVAELLEEERRLEFHELQTYLDFAKRVWSIGERLMAILQDYKDRGKVVHAFGAPAKGGTLLNSFKIGTDLVPIAVEKNQLKVGKLIPGVRLPILDEDLAPVPDAYLVLPWNFLKEFLHIKKDFIMAGGEFIVPIPEPHVITRDNYSEYSDG